MARRDINGRPILPGETVRRTRGTIHEGTVNEDGVSFTDHYGHTYFLLEDSTIEVLENDGGNK